MAGFKTHITASTLIGIGYGAAGYAYGVPLSSCMVAGGLCSVAGMLPDLDSDSGVPVREMMAFTAAVVPALMIPRFQQMGFIPEQMVLAAGLIYVAIRFGVAEIFKRYTVHRGMWHSLPAAVIAGLFAFLLVSGTDFSIRLFKSAAVVLGFLTHLALDEIWSFEVRRGRLRIKKSFGTALKFWTTQSLWANVSTYGKLVALAALVIGDPYLMQQMGVQPPQLPQSPHAWLQQAADRLPVETPLGGMLESGGGEATSLSQPPGEETQPAAETARRPFYYPITESPDRR
jgi:hypothetical protein